jgi:hypothetical protein
MSISHSLEPRVRRRERLQRRWLQPKKLRNWGNPRIWGLPLGRGPSAPSDRSHLFLAKLRGRIIVWGNAMTRVWHVRACTTDLVMCRVGWRIPVSAQNLQSAFGDDDDDVCKAVASYASSEPEWPLVQEIITLHMITSRVSSVRRMEIQRMKAYYHSFCMKCTVQHTKYF